jgi:hypothetical protein
MKSLFALILASTAMLTIAPDARAATLTYAAVLDGDSEVPPNDSLGSGTSLLFLDKRAHTLRITFDFQNLTGGTTAVHIHAPTDAPNSGTAGVATQVPTFAGTPLGVTSGTYDETFDISDASFYNPSFVAAQGGVRAAERIFLRSLRHSTGYLNIHTSAFPGGEIRGFYAPAKIPLPAGLALMLTGVAALAGFSRRRRSA